MWNVVRRRTRCEHGRRFRDVDTGNSGLQCTLRAAIQEANAREGYDYIEFNIPGGGIHTIAPASPLPLINKPVSVRGETQPGYSGTPLIEIDGVSTVGAVGLAFSTGSGGSRLAAVTVHRFDQAGVS
ncbi:MAG: hypothetical protein IPJ30_05165 [Acidobacteria bacterium]|nr:hypothetical protein [Acidobacteriota bacterium]